MVVFSISGIGAADGAAGIARMVQTPNSISALPFPSYEQEVPSGNDFWNFVCGSDIYDEVSSICHEVSEETKPEIEIIECSVL